MRRGWRVLLLLLALPLAASRAEAEKPPVVSRVGSRLTLAEIPAVLDAPEVREQLESGLTTSFVFRLTARDEHGHRLQGAAEVAVRYELWDEVFLVAATAGRAGRLVRARLDSFDRLVDWWKGLELPVVTDDDLEAGDRWQAKVELDLLPFSRAEQRDAERWLADSLGSVGKSGTEGVSEATGQEGEVGGSVFDLLIATSIRRDALRRWRWSVELPPPVPEPP